ncbi:MAG: TrkH family potassium uptake protein, partial [Lachnospiraceae bacterium]
ITVALAFSLIAGRKISLAQRNTMKEAISAQNVGGIVRLTGRVIKIMLGLELLGAIFMLPVFCRDFGIKGIWMALFHSISAFCNAGFDLMGVKEKFSSLTLYSGEPIINIVIMLLIIIGGIGFLTWEDIWTNKHHFRKYRMQSKVILCTTAILIFVPAVCFYLHEFTAFPVKERVLNSIFQAVTPRTAGFNTANLTDMSEAGLLFMIMLMLIGGSPGSTAGGMKTTTIAVLIATVIAIFSQEEDAHFFGRRIENNVVKNAVTIFLMYIILFIFGGIFISIIEELPILLCLFETASAVGTVGLTLGITPYLGMASRLILIILMFFGRVGGLTLIFAALSGPKKKNIKFPQGKITVG